VTMNERFERGLRKMKDGLGRRLAGLMARWRDADEGFYEELEETLITADVGPALSARAVALVRGKAREGNAHEPSQLKEALREHFLALLVGPAGERRGEGGAVLASGGPPSVYLVVGVNGTGKTTTIAKLAALLRSEGKSVLLAAADTFRAAAAEQLAIWADRAGVPLIKHQEGADPAAVAYDAARAALARRTDVLIVDTAGRLHTKVNLMEELKKIHRVLAREVDGAPHEVLLVVDGTTGQNAVAQARLFSEAVGVSGVILTKMDGTARGGVALSLSGELGLPIRFLGLGEGLEDLVPFDPDAYVRTLVP
jgi:fused signal recognition particle receptor